MSKWRYAIHLARKQARNLKRTLNGKPLTVTPLGSSTLDWDDVHVAKRWLNNREQWFQSEVTTEYERSFAEWNGSKHAFAFMGGRVALSACIYALDLQPGDEVIVPGYTCVVVPNAFQYAGVQAVYCDIELQTFGLDAGEVEKKITKKTRAILLHHLYGLVCRDYEAILDLAKRYNLKVIEDCAHATGAEYRGVKVGNRGDLGFYSTEQSKVINTIQGGMAVTNNEQLARRLREFYEQAPMPDIEWIDKQLHNVLLNFYQMKHPQRWWRGDVADVLYGKKRLISTTAEEEQGHKPSYYGRRMPAPIAALGLNQLAKVDGYNQRRRQTARRWDLWCAEHGYQQPFVVPDSTPVFLRYPVLVEAEKKQNPQWAYEELQVELGVWFVSNIHPVAGYLPDCPNANYAVAHCINFPGVGD